MTTTLDIIEEWLIATNVHPHQLQGLQSYNILIVNQVSNTVYAAITIIMKCTKVPGTLARTYANKHVCIFN